jgi:diguanylate cyclase (GGDEF)-like protein
VDRLTGMLDRVALCEVAKHLTEAARASDWPLTVLWVGVDRFRQINASFGHSAGDTVLANLAHRMRIHAGLADPIGRVGGDEFAILLRGQPTLQAQETALRIAEALAAPLEIGSVRVRPSVSIGLAELNPTETPANVLERAERAMGAAKQQGGSRLLLSGEEPVPGRTGTLLAREELVIEELLHDALENGGLALHYQPIVLLRDGSLEALEALMRIDVRGRRMGGGEFIPVSEKTGLIVRLGEWSLLTAARLALQLENRGTPARIAVNISRAQLTAPRFESALHAVLACADVPPQRLELELTESLFMDRSAVVRRNIDASLEAGFSLSIDDFGTGYSSLADLKNLPASKLKLDRAFVTDLPEDFRSLAIVRSVTRLARDLGIMVVAEGVEEPAQYEALSDAGVDAIQGFLFSRALEESALMQWLDQHSGGIDCPPPVRNEGVQ